MDKEKVINDLSTALVRMHGPDFKPMDLTLPKRLGFRLRLLILWSNLIDDIAIWKCERKLKQLKRPKC